MPRELTDAERAFIEESILSRDSADQRQKEARAERNRRVRNSPIFNLRIWAALAMIPPLVGTAILYIFIFQASSTVGGSDNLKWLASQKMDASAQKILKQYNLDWLQEAISIYNQRYIIIGVMFTIGIIISMVLLMLDAWRRQRRGKEN